MLPKKNWILVVLPNLVLLLGQADTRTNGRLFDEGYLAKDQQLWIKYHGEKRDYFQGVWSNQTEQKDIKGVRQGNQFVFQAGKSWWKARLNKSEKRCEQFLEIRNGLNTEANFLKANYCAQTLKKNKFF